MPDAAAARARGVSSIAGIDTTIPLHQRLVAEPDFINGDYDIHWLERFVERATPTDAGVRRR